MLSHKPVSNTSRGVQPAIRSPFSGREMQAGRRVNQDSGFDCESEITAAESRANIGQAPRGAAYLFLHSRV